MNSSVYRIDGCLGSHSALEIDNCMDAKTAARRATQLNQQNADRLGMSYRAYYTRSAGGEGWHYSTRSLKRAALSKGGAK
jgi:hypothetical protein